MFKYIKSKIQDYKFRKFIDNISNYYFDDICYDSNDFQHEDGSHLRNKEFISIELYKPFSIDIEVDWWIDYSSTGDNISEEFQTSQSMVDIIVSFTVYKDGEEYCLSSEQFVAIRERIKYLVSF